MDILRDKINLNNNDSYILFEQGGIGKTSQMKAVFRSYALSYKDGIVPIFVDCKTIDFNRKQPLLTHILLKFCGDDCPDNCENSIVRLENMLIKANSEYKYIFFIDGINECENNKYLVVQDIAKLLKSPNNKVIVSSRINEDDIGLKDFKRLRVKEFTDAQIVTFLNSKGFKDNGNDVELNRLNPSLLKILRVPMFLKLFVETYSADNVFHDMYTSNIVRKADLLQAFINKIFDDKNEQHSSENDPEYIKRQFALEHYLPALAYEMMIMHKYSINNEVLKNLRTQVFTSNYFERFEREDEVIFKNISSIKEINNICIEEFSLFNKSNENYAFSHQVWQDFFCGKFYELCIKYDILEPFENALPESVKQFIGEIIGECDFESKDNLDTEASPIEKFLQKHNSQQPENKQLSAIQTRNLVEIMKTSRNNNITADYSHLNLSLCDFSLCNCKNSIFSKSIINSYNFYHLYDQKNAYKYIKEKNRVFLGGKGGVISSIDISNGNIEQFCCNKIGNNTVRVIESLDEKRIIVGADNEELAIINLDTGDVEHKLYGSDIVLRNGNRVNSLRHNFSHSVKSIYILNKGEIIFCIGNNGMVHKWCLKNGNYSGGLLFDANSTNDYTISKNGEMIITIHAYYSGEHSGKKVLEFRDIKSGDKLPISIEGVNYESVLFVNDNMIATAERLFWDTPEGQKSKSSVKFWNIANRENIKLEKEINFENELNIILNNIDDVHFMALCTNRIIIFNKKTLCIDKIVFLKEYSHIKKCEVIKELNLVLCYSEEMLIVLNYDSGEEVTRYIFSDRLPLVYQILYSKNKDELIVLYKGIVKIVEKKSIPIVKNTLGLEKGGIIRTFALSHNQKFLATYSWDEEVSLWDIENGTRKWTTPINARACGIEGFSKKDNKIVCRGYFPPKLINIDTQNGNINTIEPLEENSKTGQELHILISGKYLYELRKKEKFINIKIFSVETKKLLAIVPIQYNDGIVSITNIIFYDSQNKLAVCSNLGSIYFYDIFGKKIDSIQFRDLLNEKYNFISSGVAEAINEKQLAIDCVGGIAIYDLEENKIVCKNDSFINSDIVGADFSRIIFKGDDEEKEIFYKTIYLNGGKVRKNICHRK